MGYAILNAVNQQFLDRCEAIKSWEELTADVAVFEFDPTVEVVGPVPYGVYFDLDRCESVAHEKIIRDAIRKRNARVLAE